MLMNQKFESPRVVDMHVGDQTIQSGDIYKILQPIIHAADMSGDLETYQASVAAFSEPQKLAHALIRYDAEIRAGGHKQYFMSPVGMLWKAALEACRAMGLRDYRMILQGAALRLAGDPPLGHEERTRLLRNLSPRFSDLDKKADALDLTAALGEYIAAHREAFLFDGGVRH